MPTIADVKQKVYLQGQVIERDYLWVTGVENTYSWDNAGNSTNFNGTGFTVNGLNQLEPTGAGSSDFVYDDDGNQTADLDWTYTYDAENRLTKMVSKSANPVHPKRLEFEYDYLHRRIEKRVYNATSGGSPIWQRIFVYDGNNVIAEVSTSQSMIRSFHWGLDRASSLTATGGLEGLLLVTRWDGPYADLPAITIAVIYKSRWEIELFFKWIKQNLRIKAFYGTSENAVRTQIWIALCVYLMVACLNKVHGINESLSRILQILSVNVFQKVPFYQLLADYDTRMDENDVSNQLILNGF